MANPWDSTNLLVNAWIDNSDDAVPQTGSSKSAPYCSLRCDGTTVLNGHAIFNDCSFNVLPTYDGSANPVGSNLITKAYADATYSGGGAGACLLNANNVFTTPSGDIIRSNANAQGYFYINQNGEVGNPNTSSGTGYNWKIQNNGFAYFRSNQNGFKYYAIEGDIFRYYNLASTNSVYLEGGAGKLSLNQIVLNGNNGLSTANSTGVTIDFKQNAPIMSGANVTDLNGSNISTGTVADARLSANVVLKNTGNTFISSSGTTENLLRVNRTLGTNPNGFFYADNYAAVGYYDNTSASQKWNIDADGDAMFKGTLDVSGNATFTGGIVATGTQTINFGTNTPTMVGTNITGINASNISTGTIADARLSANVVLKNTGNTFISSSGTTENLLRVNKTLGTNPNGFFYADNYAAVGYYDNTSASQKWNIDADGDAMFNGTLDVIGNVNMNNAFINSNLTLQAGATLTNSAGSIFNNLGTMWNNSFYTLTISASIPVSYSGSKLNVSSTSPITLSLPATSSNAGVYFWITGDDTLTTTIQVGAGSGDTIFDGSTSVSSFTLNANQTIFIQVCKIGGTNTWVYNLFDDGSSLLGYNNVWTGTNAFNTSLPTSTVTPTTSTQLITKGYADGQYVAVTGDQNITTGQKRFYKAPMLGCESATGVLTKIGYNTGTYLTDATKLVTAIGANVLKNNTAGMPLLSLCVAIGNNCLENYSPTVARDQITAVGTYALRSLVGDGQNTAVGTYAGFGLQYGQGNAIYGNGAGLGLVGTAANPCNRNFLMGGQSMSGDGRAPLVQTVFTGATQTSDTIVFSGPISLIYAGANIYFYTSATGGGISAQNTILSWDSATYTVVMNASSTIIQNSLVFIFTTGEEGATNVYPGSTATGTTFTLQNNNTNIAGGQRVVYQETATLQKYATVSSWNNTTKQIVFTTSITLFGGSTLSFRVVATTNQNRGNGYNDNCCVGNFALANSATGCSRNIAIGSAALNAVSPPTGYNGTTYIWGTDNIAIGYAAAAYTRHGTKRCIFIGSNCQQNGSTLSPYRELNEACAFGYLTNTWADFMYVFGGFNNFIYYPTNYKVCFGVTPTINSTRTDYAETGARGVLQIVCGSQDVAQNAISCKAYNDTYYIINFQNSAGVARGQIAGVNSTSVAYNTSSDERLKENIEDMPSQLDNIQKLKPRKFNWKSSGEEDNGFIAQEYYKIYPERTPHKDLYPDEMLGMDYGRCTPYLWKGVSELIDIVKQQRAEIDMLKDILSRNNIR